MKKVKEMIKRLLQVGLVLAGFASMPSWAIVISGTTTDVGVIDTFIAEDVKQGSPTDEATWINTILSGIGITVEYEVKTEDVAYFSTDTTDVFAFDLAPESSDYFILKNSQGTALFKNLMDIDWGVFDVTDLSSAMKLPDFTEYTISHVTQFNSVPEPGITGLLAIGLLGMVVARRRMKV